MKITVAGTDYVGLLDAYWSHYYNPSFGYGDYCCLPKRYKATASQLSRCFTKFD